MPASAPVAVCCPNCWKWTEVKNSSVCKRCGTPLVLPDGRRLDEARNGTAPAAVAIKAPTVSLAPLTVGTDWVSIARWITAAHGALAVLAIFAIGLLVPSITVPVADPNTGVIVDQTLNIRPALAIAALILIGVYTGFVLAIGYGWVRGVVLALLVVEALLTLGRLGAETSTGVIATIVGLLLDAGFAFVLVMTFVAPRRPAPLHPGPIAPTAMAPPPPPPPPPPTY